MRMPQSRQGRALQFMLPALCLAWTGTTLAREPGGFFPGAGAGVAALAAAAELGPSTAPAASAEPTSGAPAPAAVQGKAGDPVYDAWQEFLKQKAADGTVAQDSTAPSASGARITEGSLVGGSWGGLMATVLGGGAAAAWVAGRRGRKLGDWFRTRLGGGADDQVRVISVSSITPQGSIAVVEVAGQTLVLGVTANTVTLLTRMDGQETVAHTAQASAAPARESSLEKLNRQLDQASAAAPKPRTVPAPAHPRLERDFGAMLDSLIAPPEAAATPEPPRSRAGASSQHQATQPISTPMAAMSEAQQAGQGEAEDMAGQVLRKMRTMKRFRTQA